MAYGVKYRIPFVDIDDNQYVIEISKDNHTEEPIELDAGKDPIIVSYGDDDDIYHPLRFASATISIMVEKALFDLYATSPHEFKVELKQGDLTKFTGFITPEIFSQDYNGYLTEFQIECISALATMEYFEIDTDVSGKLDFIKGKNDAGILNMMFELIPESYQEVYFPKIFNLTETDYTMTKLWMLRENFIDDDGERWTYKDFLEEFCKFFGWTLTEKDGKVYFLDLDFMKSYNQWFKYDGKLTNGQSIALSNEIQYLSEEESTGSNNTINMLPAYNRVSVKASDYEFTAKFPELRDLKGYTDHSPKYYIECLFIHSRSNNRKDKQTWALYRYYTNNTNIIPYLYDSSNNRVENYPTDFNTLDYYMGARIERHQRYNDKEMGSVDWEYGPVYVFKNFLGAANSNGQYTVDPHATTNTLLGNGGTTLSNTGKACLTLKTDQIVMSNTYLQINFKSAITKEQSAAFTDITLWAKDKFEHVARKGTYDYFFVPAKLQFANLFWNGSRWTTTETTFIIKLSASKGDHTSTGFFKEIQKNQVVSSTVSGFEEGYVVPVTSQYGFNDIQFGSIEFTLYYPRYEWNTSADHRGATFAFIKDLSLKLKDDEEEEDQYLEARKDTIFSAVNEDGDYINDYDDIELKITSHSKAEPIKSYSRVFMDNDVLENISHWGISANGDIAVNDRPEYHILCKYLTQYSVPRIKLTQDTTIDYQLFRFVEDSTFPNERFFITHEEINYRDNISSLTMQQII